MTTTPSPEATEPLVERVKSLVLFHRSGGHEGDGSDVNLDAIDAALSSSISNAEACSTCQGTGIDECPGYYEGQAECPHCEGTGTTEGVVQAWPQAVGRLILDGRLSDGEVRCGWDHDVPAGHPLYWPPQIGKYDDSDPCCLEHAIEQYASETGYGASAQADHRLAFSRPEPVGAGEGWIVGDASGSRWRGWVDGNVCWTFDRDRATRYARREDAENVHREDEDAWSVQPYLSAPPHLPPPEPVGDGALVERMARKHIETLEFLATQYLPGGPRDIKGALRAAIAALAKIEASLPKSPSAGEEA